VLTAGTGGTLTGVARKIKEKFPHAKVIGVDPDGSILALPESLNGAIHSYKVEGTGYDFIPTVCDRDPLIVDKWYKSFDKESFVMARRLIRQEGLLCGGSSGAAMAAAIQAAKDFGFTSDHRVVVILPDSVRNYMTKFLNDGWMLANGFKEPSEEDKKKDRYRGAVIRDLNLPDAVVVSTDKTCSETTVLMQKGGFDQVPVVDGRGLMVGLVTIGNLLSKISSQRVLPSDSVSKAMFTFDTKSKFEVVTMDTRLSDLTKFFENHAAAFVTTPDGAKVLKVVTQVDLLHYLIANKL